MLKTVGYVFVDTLNKKTQLSLTGRARHHSFQSNATVEIIAHI